LLLLGLLFHLAIEYALNLPMFAWDVLAAYVLFVDPADLARWWSAVRQLLGRSVTVPLPESGDLTRDR
jgi:hypothetical protein